MDDLFSLDNVRDFMLSKGGKVKNHDLVTHFKTFLNDPTRKASNRQQFKTFVNTLATVKLDESGEKILVLKKKYRDSAATDNRPQDKPRHEVHHDFSTPMPKAPPRKIHKGAALWEDSAVGEAAADASVGMEGAMSDVNALYEAAAAATVDDTNLEPTSTAAVTVTGLPTNESSSDLGTLVITGVPESESSTDATDHIHISGIPTSESCTEPEGFVQLQGMHGNESTTDPVDAAPSEPERVEIRITDSLPSTTPSDTSSERDSPFVSETVSLASEASSMKGESCLTSETSSIRETSPDAQPPVTYPASYSTMSPEEDDKIPNATPMSVKDRAKHLNKIVSESDIHSNKAKENKTDRGDRKGDDDSSSVSSVPISMDAAEREWLVLSSMADYHPMAKVLLQSPHLAKRKNFMNGFNPLHWAAKHGKPEVIKLLCGTHCVDVNARSHGGYTALHLAAMHGHEEIIELLVHGYGADPNIRDYSGKKAKQYLPTYASTRAHLGLMTVPRMLDIRPVTTIVLTNTAITHSRPTSSIMIEAEKPELVRRHTEPARHLNSDQTDTPMEGSSDSFINNQGLDSQIIDINVIPPQEADTESSHVTDMVPVDCLNSAASMQDDCSGGSPYLIDTLMDSNVREEYREESPDVVEV